MIERVSLTPYEASELTKLQREHDQLARRTAVAAAAGGVESAAFIEAKDALMRNTRKIESLLDKSRGSKNVEEDDS